MSIILDGMEQILGNEANNLSEKIINSLDIFKTKNISILKTSKHVMVSKKPNMHTHRCYEFYISLSNDFLIKIENRKRVVEKGKLFAINPLQVHGPSQIILNDDFITIQVNKEFLNNIHFSIYKKKEAVFNNDSYKINDDFLNLIFFFIIESKLRQKGHALMIDCLEKQITVLILRFFKKNKSKKKTGVVQFKDNILNSINFLIDNFNKDLNLKQVADISNLSTYHFIRVFKTETGKTPYKFLLDIKIEKAKYLLSDSSKSIAEICYACGFANQSHFAKVFKKYFCKTPSAYRKEIQEKMTFD